MSLKSSFLKLKKNNIIKALVMAIGSAIVMYMIPFFTDGSGKDMFDITTSDLLQALKYGINAGVTYLVATFFTNNKGQFFKSDKK